MLYNSLYYEFFFSRKLSKSEVNSVLEVFESEDGFIPFDVQKILAYQECKEWSELNSNFEFGKTFVEVFSKMLHYQVQVSADFVSEGSEDCLMRLIEELGLPIVEVSRDIYNPNGKVSSEKSSHLFYY